jgi:hypothetical protein
MGETMTMASEKQVNANRENAKRSTGPKTAGGKLRSSMNALKHGLTSQRKITIWGESDVYYYKLLSELMLEYDPQTAFQTQLVEHLASNLWRLHRGAAFEAGIFDIRCAEVWRDSVKLGSKLETDGDEAQECANSGLLGMTFLREAQAGDALSKLSRYETTLMNNVRKIRQLLEEEGCRASPVPGLELLCNPSTLDRSEAQDV